MPDGLGTDAAAIVLTVRQRGPGGLISIIFGIMALTVGGFFGFSYLMMAAQQVRFTSSDGIELGGWYIPTSNHSAVVLRHASGSTCSGVLPQAAVLAGHGYGALLTDARGHGISSGRAMDFGWYGSLDIKGAVSFLEKQGDVDARRIGVIGLSMGGEEAIGAAAEDPRISAVIEEGALVKTFFEAFLEASCQTENAVRSFS